MAKTTRTTMGEILAAVVYDVRSEPALLLRIDRALDQIEQSLATIADAHRQARPAHGRLDVIEGGRDDG